MERPNEDLRKANGGVVVNILENKTVFRVMNGGQNKILQTLDLGYQHIGRKFFRNFPPTVAEVDSAINTVEEAIVPLSRYFKDYAVLYATDVYTELVFRLSFNVRKDPEGYEVLPRVEVENLFTRLSHIINGLPASQDEIPEDVEFAAFLLILREILHHLDFTEVKVFV